MQNPLQRLYQTRLVLLAVLATVVGAALMAVCFWADPATRSKWFINSVLGLGGTLLGIGLLAIFFQYVGNEDAERRDDERTDRLLTKHAPAFRDAVIQGFAFNADDLARVANPAVLDQIARNVLALQLGDRGLADDAYTDLRNQVIRAPERWRDLGISVALSPWTQGSSGSDAMFVATLRWEYRVVPASRTVRFTCVTDETEYRELLRDPTVASVWRFGRPAGINAASREAYELIEFAVDGQSQPIRRTERTGAQTYTTVIPAEVEVGQEVTITSTYRVLVKQHGHLLYLDLPQPTKGLRVEFAYGGCGLRAVDPLYFIASSEQARVSRTPASVPTPSIVIGFDGWVFPKSGVAFVWSLVGEADTPSHRRRNPHTD